MSDGAYRAIRQSAFFCVIYATCLVSIWAQPVVEKNNSIQFADETTASGLMFEHYTGSKGRFMLPEITGSGGAALDYDRDGDMDLYLVQGSYLEGSLLVKIRVTLMTGFSVMNSRMERFIGLTSQRKQASPKLDTAWGRLRATTIMMVGSTYTLPISGETFY